MRPITLRNCAWMVIGGIVVGLTFFVMETKHPVPAPKEQPLRNMWPIAIRLDPVINWDQKMIECGVTMKSHGGLTFVVNSQQLSPSLLRFYEMNGDEVVPEAVDAMGTAEPRYRFAETAIFVVDPKSFFQTAVSLPFVMNARKSEITIHLSGGEVRLSRNHTYIVALHFPDCATDWIRAEPKGMDNKPYALLQELAMRQSACVPGLSVSNPSTLVIE